MASRFFVVMALAAFLAAPVCACWAAADGGDADLSLESPKSSGPSDPAQTTKQAEMAHKMASNVCEITGIVAKLENVERSPWTDGTPSALSVYETDIAITVKDRRPHYRTAPADSICNKGAKGEMRIYKVCSPTVLKKGDRIHATEGLQTGSAKSASCLFDIIVIPPAEDGKKI